MMKFSRQESVAYFSPSEKFVNETNSQVGKSAFISLKRKKLTAGNSRGGIFGLILEEGSCGKAEDESGDLGRFQLEATGGVTVWPANHSASQRWLDGVPTR